MTRENIPGLAMMVLGGLAVLWASVREWRRQRRDARAADVEREAAASGARAVSEDERRDDGR